MSKSIGVFGGSFDPVHIGHLRMVLEAGQALKLDAVHWVPSARPPHRDPALASNPQRLAMLRLAVRDVPGWQVDERELNRDGPSWTVDTLQSFREQYPEATLFLMMGGDAFDAFESWHRWEQILELAHIVVMQRPGDASRPDPGLDSGSRCDRVAGQSLDDQLEAAADCTRQQSAGCIIRLSLSSLAIASSDIRARLRRGESARFLLSDAVVDYVDAQGLYLEAPHAASSHDEAS